MKILRRGREVTIAEKTVSGRSNSKHFPGAEKEQGIQFRWVEGGGGNEARGITGRETRHTGISKILRSCWALLGKFAKILIYILQKNPSGHCSENRLKQWQWSVRTLSQWSSQKVMALDQGRFWACSEGGPGCICWWKRKIGINTLMTEWPSEIQKLNDRMSE